MAELQYCTFYLDNALFGINIILVREINRQIEMTPVHNLPPYIRGLLNLRGQIITVLDTGIKLGLPERTVSDSSRIIILKTVDDHGQAVHTAGSDVVGLLVDRIGDVVRVNEGDIERPPANMGDINGKFLTGVVKLDGRLLALVKVEDLVS